MSLTKKLYAAPNKYGIGIDVGWLFIDDNGEELRLKWGNTRDAETLRSLVADCQQDEQHDGTFELDESVTRILEAP